MNVPYKKASFTGPGGGDAPSGALQTSRPLGYLFKKTEKGKRKTNLVIMLTP